MSGLVWNGWIAGANIMEIAEAMYAELAAAARRAAGQAYCPYSRFPVGAALLTDQGEVFAGCNVENASYGLTMCAERNAVFQAIAGSRGRLMIRAVVVYTPTTAPTAPCGGCRQVINEFGPDAEIVSICDGEGVIRASLASLLPQAFGPGNLTG
jgi:cytidine deaminase